MGISFSHKAVAAVRLFRCSVGHVYEIITDITSMFVSSYYITRNTIVHRTMQNVQHFAGMCEAQREMICSLFHLPVLQLLMSF